MEEGREMKERILHPSLLSLVDFSVVRTLCVDCPLGVEEWGHVFDNAPLLVKIIYSVYQVDLVVFDFLLNLRGIHATIRLLNKDGPICILDGRRSVFVAGYSSELSQVVDLTLGDVIHVDIARTRDAEKWYEKLHSVAPKRVTIIPNPECGRIIYTAPFLRLCEYSRAVWVTPRRHDLKGHAWFVIDKDCHWLSYCPFIHTRWQDKAMREFGLIRKCLYS